jgi:probable HAF family extracellular repeat protein
MTVIDLGALSGTGNSEAHDINVDDLVVGYSGVDGGDSNAFVWHAELGMQPLGTLGGANSIAYGVNSSGQIVGESQTASGETHATLWTITLAVAAVIDVRPGSDDNRINPRSHGMIPVALLSTEFLDATTVDPASLIFGPDEAHVIHAAQQDVNGDGTLDLILTFSVPETGIACGDTEVTLSGETFGGQAIQGTDSITTVGCVG